MLGVTPDREPRPETRRFIEETGAEYPYAYVRGSSLKKVTGQRAFPHAALIDPGGKVVWVGHPGRLTKGIVQKHLKGASKFLTFGWPAAFQSVAKAIAKLEFAKALAEVEKLADKDGADIVKADVSKMITSRVSKMEAAMEKGDYYGAHELAETLDGQLKGLPEAEKVDAVLDHLKTDKSAKRAMKAQAGLRKLMDVKITKRKEAEKMLKKVNKILEENDGTYVGDEAAKFISKLRTLILAL